MEAAPHEAPPPRWLFRGLTMNGTVLIIEDDARIANWVKVYFERAGFSAEVAYDGESGLALARNLAPGLIILDLMHSAFNAGTPGSARCLQPHILPRQATQGKPPHLPGWSKPCET